MFLVLQNHFPQQQRLPMRLQLLATPTLEPVLHNVVSNTIARDAQLLSQRLAGLPASTQGICFRQLLLGDGGYQAASRASLANSWDRHAAQYGREPSFLSSADWWGYRQLAMQVRGRMAAQRLVRGVGKWDEREGREEHYMCCACRV
jgi:hypothetical protein